MEIYLIRHTTPAIEKGICYGQSDLDVAETFEIESAEVLKKVSFDKNSIVYSSPLKRCTKLASKFSNQIIVDQRLLEMDFGDWELKKWDDISSEVLLPWMDDFVNVTVPNGESFQDLNRRSSLFFNEIIKNTSSNNIIIVAHSGVIRSILAQLKGIELKHSFDMEIAYSQVFKVIKLNNSFKII